MFTGKKILIFAGILFLSSHPAFSAPDYNLWVVLAKNMVSCTSGTFKVPDPLSEKDSSWIYVIEGVDGNNCLFKRTVGKKVLTCSIAMPEMSILAKEARQITATSLPTTDESTPIMVKGCKNWERPPG